MLSLRRAHLGVAYRLFWTLSFQGRAVRRERSFSKLMEISGRQTWLCELLCKLGGYVLLLRVVKGVNKPFVKVQHLHTEGTHMLLLLLLLLLLLWFPESSAISNRSHPSSYPGTLSAPMPSSWEKSSSHFSTFTFLTHFNSNWQVDFWVQVTWCHEQQQRSSAEIWTGSWALALPVGFLNPSLWATFALFGSLVCPKLQTLQV